MTTKESEKETVMSPADIAKKHKEESAERKEAASYRFPEGDDLPGKVISAEDTLSMKKKSPCYEITVKTKEKNKKGKKVDIIIRFMKNPKSMGFFYAFLELAGADLSKLRYKKQETLDEDIQALLERLDESNPKIVFNCKHQEAPSTFNNYYVNECDAVLADGDTKDESESESDKGGKESDTSDAGESGASNGGESNSDSAFDDDDD